MTSIGDSLIIDRFRFRGVGLHDFRPNDSPVNDNDNPDLQLECIYCGIACRRDAIAVANSITSCYQEQLLMS